MMLTLFHSVLTSSSLKQEILPFKKEKETYDTNQYYLFTIVDFIMKYQILHKDRKEEYNFLCSLNEIFHTSSNYREFFMRGNQLLAFSIQAKLGLENIETEENKKRILEYAYKHYIEEGYYFYSFPSSMKTKVKKQGLYKEKDYPLLDEMKEVNQIFERHKIKNVFGISPEDFPKDYYEITDSPSISFYQALEAPRYFCHFTSTGIGCDKIAYYRKDRDTCSKNIENFCNLNHFNAQEKEKIMNYFNKQWNELDGDHLIPMTILIKRKAIGRNALVDHDAIIASSSKEDLLVSLSKILDSRHPLEKRYSKLLPVDFLLYEFPTYEAILENRLKKLEIKVEKKKDLEKKEQPIVRSLQNNHGNADVIALLGFLSIAVGLTLMIFHIYFKVQ